MPTYEYECHKCGLIFERFQSMTEEPLKKCVHPAGCRHPKAAAKVTRLIGTGAGIIFKGSGFYQTDYRSKDYTEAAKKESEPVPTNGKDSSVSSKETASKSDTDSKSTKAKK